MDLYDDIPPPASEVSDNDLSFNLPNKQTQPISLEVKKPISQPLKPKIIPFALLTKTNNSEKKPTQPPKPKPVAVQTQPSQPTQPVKPIIQSSSTTSQEDAKQHIKESMDLAEQIAKRRLEEISRENEEMQVVHDEYDPFHPNDFDSYLKEKERLSRQAIQQKEMSFVGGSGGGGLGSMQQQQPQQQHQLQTTNQVVKQGGVEESSIDPKGGDFAARLMKKYGWKEGQGLGKDSQGMLHPLLTKKTDTKGTSGVIINQHSAHSSNVILIENMVDISEVDSSLEDEIKEECSKYGRVVMVKIIAIEPVKVFVEFTTNQEANTAVAKLNGRFFGGKKISTKLYPREQFADQQYHYPV